MSVQKSVVELANAINKFKEDASTATDSQLLEAWKVLQHEGLSRDAEYIFLKVENKLLKERLKEKE